MACIGLFLLFVRVQAGFCIPVKCQVFPDLHSEYLHIRMLEIGFLLKMAPISWLLEGHIAVLV